MCRSKSQGGMSPAFTAMTATNPGIGEGFERLRQARAGGYTGPVDQRGNRALGPMLDDMRQWRGRGRPVPEPALAAPISAQMASLLGCDTPEGLERYERGRAYREAGYTGPLDTGNRIPDPDDPANREALHALAALSETSS